MSNFARFKIQEVSPKLTVFAEGCQLLVHTCRLLEQRMATGMSDFTKSVLLAARHLCTSTHSTNSSHSPTHCFNSLRLVGNKRVVGTGNLNGDENRKNNAYRICKHILKIAVDLKVPPSNPTFWLGFEVAVYRPFCTCMVTTPIFQQNR